ncbi:MAG: peptidoglycan DD-metalloendopeptidase family protein [Massilibacteroides sp.]|nr:peptidoglycan DD-metalloendopeptidase family protein [Massilibacteroides sp.]MDD3062075.1 peptidoglycan DD-metalloendopeptidase family protein [Massilibacteroides sp.]MDD4114101.1 peptidoglycan DD-metalloendopeptidase family protein [Massilibacteroides sp.]MDD4659619.1 peptidoglycan DD-metalloendopeptidase family protein [Massilibacteroides sp.]
MNNIKILLFAGCSLCFTSAVVARNNEKKVKIQKTKQIQRMDERVSELMADRVGFKKDIFLNELKKIEDVMLEEELASEELMFPADELYGSHWENKWVNPFRNTKIDFPDSAKIDCSHFILPIDNEIKVTSKYGPRRRRMHYGIDLKVYVGDTIRAAFDGRVRIRSWERRGYGKYLVLRHPNGLETVYGHLSGYLVKENQIVRAGQPIGLGGNTGRSTGSHLHFETRFLGQPINPEDIIDFQNGVPHQDIFVFHNLKINGRKSNIYTSSNVQMVYHKVRSGETLGGIARKYRTTVNNLCRLNGLKRTSLLRIGQALRVSTGVESSVPQKQTSQTVKQATKKVKTKVEATSQAVADMSGEATPVYHRIQTGDTLGAIAIKYGTTVTKLCELNQITRTTVLKLGRKIRCS